MARQGLVVRYIGSNISSDHGYDKTDMMVILV